MDTGLIMTRAFVVLFIVFSFGCAHLAFCLEAGTLEQIVVKPRALRSRTSFVQSLSTQDIEDADSLSLADTLERVSGLDLRYRSPHGVQGDLSLRGSTFEQVGVAIEGIKLMDPQTGHHNLDIPLTRYDVEKIDVLKEGASVLYGAGPLAGVIDFRIKKPTEKSLELESAFGEHAFFEQSFSLRLPEDDFSTRLSFSHAASKAAQPNTDFENSTATFYLNKDFQGNCVDTFVGYQEKDFGASNFYSNLFPEEEEHTRTLFMKLKVDARAGSLPATHAVFWRMHRDKFVLQRNNPQAVNYHTTHVYGLNSQLRQPTRYADIMYAGEVSADEIRSTNLGSHARMHEGASVGILPTLSDRFSMELRARSDYFQGWRWQESYYLGSGLSLSRGLRLKASFDHSFRNPTFTELYYSDAANIGNAQLVPEEADNYQLGLEYIKNRCEIEITGFLRRGKNLIDWVRQSTDAPWKAQNIGKVDFSGLECSVKVPCGIENNVFSVSDAVFSYAYTYPDKEPDTFLSKYALDILKHQLLLDINSEVLGLDFLCQFSYNQRYYGENYFVGNLCVSKKLRFESAEIEPFVRIDNVSDTEYSEVGQVMQPGRWVKGGMRFSW